MTNRDFNYCTTCRTEYSVQNSETSKCLSCIKEKIIDIDTFLKKIPEVKKAIKIIEKRKFQLEEMFVNENFTDADGTSISPSGAKKMIQEIDTHLNGIPDIEETIRTFKEKRARLKDGIKI